MIKHQSAAQKGDADSRDRVLESQAQDSKLPGQPLTFTPPRIRLRTGR